MEHPLWTDATSYARGEDRKPRVWEVRLGEFRLVVLCRHRHYPQEWICHFLPVWDTKQLGLSAKTPDENKAAAQEKALKMAHKVLFEAAQAAKQALVYTGD